MKVRTVEDDAGSPAATCLVLSSLAGPPSATTIGAILAMTKLGYIHTRSAIQASVMASFDRITSDPSILNGQPVIRGMRLSVRRVIEALAIYPNWDDLRREYPELEPEDIRQALAFAAQSLDSSVTPFETV